MFCHLFIYTIAKVWLVGLCDFFMKVLGQLRQEVVSFLHVIFIRDPYPCINFFLRSKSDLHVCSGINCCWK